MKNIIKAVLLVIICITVLNPMTAYGLSNQSGSDPSGKSQRYVIENAPWFDPTACATTSPAINNPNLQGKVYIIGDSITQNEPYVQISLADALKKRGFTDVIFNSLASRSFTSGTSKFNGITIFETDPAWRDANTIIVELGTNGGVSKENIKTMMDQIKANNPTANVFWINVGANNNQRQNPIDTSQIDNTLQDNASLGYKVIDWKSVVDQHPEYISDLGVHPFTDSGGRAYVDTLISSLSQDVPNPSAIGGNCECSVGVGENSINLVGNSTEEKVWNFLISAGYSKAQVAGIMGNMFAESGINPRRMQGTKTPEGDSDYPLPDKPGQGTEDSTGYGLVQWTPGYKIIPYANSKNKLPGDLGLQLELLIGQLNGDPAVGLNEKVAGDDLKKQTTPEDAAESFMNKFERPLEKLRPITLPVRQEKAKYFYNLFANGGGYSGPDGACASQSTASGTGAKIAEVAETEFRGGANEENLGYRKYLPSGVKDSFQGWCDYFVSWVLREAGAPFKGGYGPNNSIITPVPSILRYFEKNNTFHPARSGYVPKIGDVVIYRNSEGVYSHVNIVVGVNGDQITTIGGNEENEDDKNVGKIARRTRSYNDPGIYGFGTQGK